MQGIAFGGFIYGQVVKNFPNLPRLPALGRSGTVALACYLLKPSNQIVRDVGMASAAIAGFTFGEKGAIAGGHDEEVLLADEG